MKIDLLICDFTRKTYILRTRYLFRFEMQFIYSSIVNEVLVDRYPLRPVASRGGGILSPPSAMCSGVFRILILRVPSVNRIFPLRVLTAGAISLFLNITGAIAPMAPVLNTPLHINLVLKLTC